MSLLQNVLIAVIELTLFDYQSECHCSKTRCIALHCRNGLITSQNVTAPKPNDLADAIERGLITSQNVTAPKLADGEGAPQIYCAANSKPQASLAYGAVVKMVRQSKELSNILRKGTVVERDEDGIIFDRNMGYITTLSSQTRRLDGLDVHCALFDELAACVNRDQYDLLDEGMASRDQPLMLCITTNGFERGNIFDNRYEYGCGVLDGTVDDDRYLPILYELDSREEWRDDGCWPKANPGLGTIKKLSALKDHVKEALQNPEKLPSVLTKDFNVPENKAVAWLRFEFDYQSECHCSKTVFEQGFYIC